jgi:hypothetical protein
MFYFVLNFIENLSFRVVLEESITLFLVAMAEITNQIRQHVETVGYADDWAIFTSDRDMQTAETNMQIALNGETKWTRQKRI